MSKEGRTDLEVQTHTFISLWLSVWEEGTAEGIEKFVAAMTEDGIYSPSPFSIAKGRAMIRRYMQMILTQTDGSADPPTVIGWVGDQGVALWGITYRVRPREEWSNFAPLEAIESEEWSTYRAIPFSPNGNRIRQEGIALVRFNNDGLVTELREWWDTKIID